MTIFQLCNTCHSTSMSGSTGSFVIGLIGIRGSLLLATAGNCGQKSVTYLQTFEPPNWKSQIQAMLLPKHLKTQAPGMSFERFSTPNRPIFLSCSSNFWSFGVILFWPIASLPTHGSDFLSKAACVNRRFEHVCFHNVYLHIIRCLHKRGLHMDATILSTFSKACLQPANLHDVRTHSA